MRTSTAVMLSVPPKKLARSIRFRQASSREAAVVTISWMCSSLDEAGEPVGAEQVDVAEGGVLGEDVDVDVLADAEGAGDDVGGELAHLLVGHPGGHVAGVADERVVAGELEDLRAADAVAAAVADVADGDLVGRAA